MPINTDQLDLSQPLAGQDVPKSAPIPNPVISKERLTQYRTLLDKASGNAPAAAEPAAAPAATPAARVPLTAPSGPTSRERARALPGEEPAAAPAPVAEPAAPAAEPEAPPAFDASSLISPRQREHFKRLEQARNSFKERAEKAEKALAEREARLHPLEEEVTKLRTATPADLESVRAAAAKADALAAENAKLLAKVESIDFERSDRFQNWWKEATESNIKLAQRHVAPEHRDKLGKLLMEEPSMERSKALGEILEGADEASKLVIAGAMKDVEVAKIKRAEALAENSGSLQKLRAVEANERAQQERALAARRDQITQAALNRAAQFDAFKPIEGDADHNASIEVKRDFIRAAISGQLDEDIAVSLPGLAFEAVHLRDKVLPALRAELEKERALVKQLQSAGAPPRGSGGSPATGETTAKPGAAGKFLEALRKASAGGG